MNFKQYEDFAAETAIYPSEFGIIYPVLGLVGEAGEVAEKVKKVLRDDGGNFTEQKKVEISKEIGDVLWYLSAICRDMDISLSECAERNIVKLRSRQERGVIRGSGDNR
jgi:NTP pyrophosphatase (non-canonical NTP hydrolase)